MVEGTDTDPIETEEEHACPLPSAHDKLEEAHYFLHEMITHYHSGLKFRWSLSAFLQALNTVPDFVEKELPQDVEKRGSLISEMKSVFKSEEMKPLKKSRDHVVHNKALVAGSSAMIGFFRGYQSKLNFSSRIDPFEDSVDAYLRLLAISNEHDLHMVHPHRAFDGENLGVERKWVLDEAPDREIIELCHAGLNAVAAMVSKLHQASGAESLTLPLCAAPPASYQMLLELDLLPQIGRIWDGDPPDVIRSSGEQLILRVGPHRGADCRAVVGPGDEVRGWVGRAPVHWNREFASAILYSHNGTILNTGNTVFFEESQSRVSPGEQLPAVPDETDASAAGVDSESEEA